MQQAKNIYIVLFAGGAGIGISFVVRAFARRNDKEKPYETTPKKSSKKAIPEKLPVSTGKETIIEPIDIPGTIPPATKYRIVFDVEVGALEKLAVSTADVKKAVTENIDKVISRIVDQQRVAVSSNDAGYRVRVTISTTQQPPVAKVIAQRIEKIDDRLKGRISSVVVQQIENAA